jgi:hypothetical protein
LSSSTAARIALRLLAVGVIAVAVGLWMGSSDADEVPRIVCDDQVMGPGDTCLSTDPSQTGSYEDLVQRRRESGERAATNGPVVVAVGGTVSVASVLVLVAIRVHVMRREREDPRRLVEADAARARAREQKVRRAAEAGDQAAMARLVRLLSETGRAAEAAHWHTRVEEAWAEGAVSLGGRRYPPLVLVAVVLCMVFVVLAATLSGYLFVIVSGTEDDEALVVVLSALALGAAAVAGTMLWAVIGLVRGSESAAQRARGVASGVGVLIIVAMLWLFGMAVLSDESGTFMLQLVSLGAGVAVPLIGLSVLLDRCAPRMVVVRRS